MTDPVPFWAVFDPPGRLVSAIVGLSLPTLITEKTDRGTI